MQLNQLVRINRKCSVKKYLETKKGKPTKFTRYFYRMLPTKFESKMLFVCFAYGLIYPRTNDKIFKLIIRKACKKALRCTQTYKIMQHKRERFQIRIQRIFTDNLHSVRSILSITTNNAQPMNQCVISRV